MFKVYTQIFSNFFRHI